MSPLADFLARHRDALRERFLAREAQELEAQGVTARGADFHEPFFSHFLDDVLAALRAERLPPAHRHTRHAHARAHGAFRREGGAQLRALVREYGLLRDCLYALVEEPGRRPACARCASWTSACRRRAWTRWPRTWRRARTALREGDALLQAIVDQAPAAIDAKDVQGRYPLVNAYFCTHLGVTREQTLGHTDLEMVPPEQARRVRENDRRVLEQNAPQECEEVVRHADGPHTYISIKFPVPRRTGARRRWAASPRTSPRASCPRTCRPSSCRRAARSPSRWTTRRRCTPSRGSASSGSRTSAWWTCSGRTGSCTRAEMATRDPALAPLLERTRPYPPHLGSGSPVARVVESGRRRMVSRITPAWLEASARDAEHRVVLEVLAPHTAVIAPLVAQRRTLGVINLASRDPCAATVRASWRWCRAWRTARPRRSPTRTCTAR